MGHELIHSPLTPRGFCSNVHGQFLRKSISIHLVYGLTLSVPQPLKIRVVTLQKWLMKVGVVLVYRCAQRVYDPRTSSLMQCTEFSKSVCPINCSN